MKFESTKGLFAATVLFGAVAQVDAAVIGLDFEGIADQAMIQEFYNGGMDSAGNSGTNFGVSFTDEARGLVDLQQGGSGDFENEPSPDTVLFFLNPAGAAILNFAAGFSTGFSFFYSASDLASAEPVVTLYDGPDGTGTPLASLDLQFNWQNDGCSTLNGLYCNWDPAGVAFDGTALSIVFAGDANLVGFDNVTFGAINPVPLPAGVWLLGSGLLGLAALRRRRQSVGCAA